MPRHILTPQERAKGQFKKGHSGNPRGGNTIVTKRGANEAARKAFGEAVKLSKEVLIQVQDVQVRKALAGDSFAASIVLRHHVPISRTEPQPVVVPGYDDPDPVVAARAVIGAVARGEIAPERGDLMISSLAKGAQLAFMSDQVAKLYRIDELLKRRGGSGLLPEVIE